MSFAGSLLEQSRAYRTWQISRVRRKRTPVLVHDPSRWAELVLSEERFAGTCGTCRTMVYLKGSPA
jgi:hypothetical protein